MMVNLSMLKMFYLFVALIVSNLFANEVRAFSPWVISWTDECAVAKNEKTNETITIYKQSIVDTTMMESGKSVPLRNTNKYKMLSIVVPYISYKHTFFSEPYIHQTSCGDEFVTIDLDKKGAAVSLETIFNENDIFNALVKDDFIISKSHGENGNLDDLLNNISGGCELFMTSGEILQSFAFHHLADNKVAVRLGISHLCDITEGKFTQVGIYLEVPADKKNVFVNAAEQNTYMDKLSKKK